MFQVQPDLRAPETELTVHDGEGDGHLAKNQAQSDSLEIISLQENANENTIR